MKRCFVLWFVSLVALAAAMLITAGAASAAAPYTCSGSFDNPGVLSGTYSTNVFVSGACGGFNCDPSGVFTLFDSPVFSVIGEGSHVGGNVTITGLTSCWLGLTHSRFDGSINVLNNQLADPDAIEILDNDIAGNIVCEQNSMMWDSADITEALYPRLWEPNRVSGMRVGQ